MVRLKSKRRYGALLVNGRRRSQRKARRYGALVVSNPPKGFRYSRSAYGRRLYKTRKGTVRSTVVSHASIPGLAWQGSFVGKVTKKQRRARARAYYAAHKGRKGASVAAASVRKAKHIASGKMLYGNAAKSAVAHGKATVVNPRKGKKSRRARRNPYQVVRTNPMFVRTNPFPGLTAPVESILRKVPVVGAPAAAAVGLLPGAALGAVALEIPLRAQSIVSGWEWMPEVLKDQKVYLVGSGAILGALAAMFFPGSAETKKAVGLSIASAAAGAAYWQWRTDSLCEAAGIQTPSETVAEATGTEAGTTAGLGALLTMDGLGSMAPAYSVESGGYEGFSGPAPYGALMTGA